MTNRGVSIDQGHAPDPPLGSLTETHMPESDERLHTCSRIAPHSPSLDGLCRFTFAVSPRDKRPFPFPFVYLST